MYCISLKLLFKNKDISKERINNFGYLKTKNIDRIITNQEMYF